jgi:hypothetical protein
MKAIALLYVGMGAISKAIRKPIQKFSVAAVFQAANGHSLGARRQAEIAGWLFPARQTVPFRNIFVTSRRRGVLMQVPDKTGARTGN